MSITRVVAGTLTMAFLVGVVYSSEHLYTVEAQEQVSPEMSFFITSEGMGDGARLRTLRDADSHCSLLGARAGVPGTWRAYLSTQPQAQLPSVHARNRIGTGPWHNAKGVLIAKDVDHLHSDSNHLTKATALNEKGETVNGRGDTPNMHDILTGSGPDGRAIEDGDTTCRNWTSNSDGSAMVGHHDREGGGAAGTSWNAAHPSKGCSQANLQATGGNGFFYCFKTE